jgi:hypothetical protein
MSTAAPQQTGLLNACPTCRSDQIVTIGYRGEWWCECRLCGARAWKRETPSDAIGAWQEYALSQEAAWTAL